MGNRFIGDKKQSVGKTYLTASHKVYVLCRHRIYYFRFFKRTVMNEKPLPRGKDKKHKKKKSNTGWAVLAFFISFVLTMLLSAATSDTVLDLVPIFASAVILIAIIALGIVFDIIGLAVDDKTCRRLSLSWGVKPMMCEMYPSVEVLFYTAKRVAKEALGLKAGDKIIITGGHTDGKSGNTDLIKIETI